MPKIILASASPRRKILLQRLGLEFDSIPVEIDESIRPGETPEDAVVRIAGLKAQALDFAEAALIVAADTLVVLGNEIMGKPLDEQDAFNKLNRLSGNWHRVVTGLCVRNTATGQSEVEIETTRVCFRSLQPKEIRAYISTGEPLDKAGAYGIQGLAAIFVAGIEGCYFNVVGLPLSRLYLMLKRQGFDLLGVE